MSGEPVAAISTSPTGTPHLPAPAAGRTLQSAEKFDKFDRLTTAPSPTAITTPPQSPLASPPASPFASDETNTLHTDPSSASSSPSVRPAMSDAKDSIPAVDMTNKSSLNSQQQRDENGQAHSDSQNGTALPSPAPAFSPEASEKDLLAHYHFPGSKMRKVMNDSARTPLVLVACGSFNPPTFAHLRMFEMAFDFVKRNTRFELVGEFISPVGDAYKKPGLEEASHRITMCELAVEKTDRIAVDPWEAYHHDYTRTASVISHFEHEINTVRGGVVTKEGERRDCSVALLAGADLIGTMSTPGLWSDDDLDFILRRGAFIIERSGTSIDEALARLQQWRDNIYVIPQLIQNDISSTKIRAFLKKDMSVRWLIDNKVITYIEEQDLYDEDGIRPHSRSRSLEAQANVTAV